jgi:hypothetical protein
MLPLRCLLGIWAFTSANQQSRYRLRGIAPRSAQAQDSRRTLDALQSTFEYITHAGGVTERDIESGAVLGDSLVKL